MPTFVLHYYAFFNGHLTANLSPLNLSGPFLQSVEQSLRLVPSGSSEFASGVSPAPAPPTMDPGSIFYGVLAFAWLEFLWEAYLSHRQRRVYATHTHLPAQLESIMSAETFEKARSYALDKSRFGAVEGIFSQVLSTILMWFLAFKHVWNFAG